MTAATPPSGTTVDPNQLVTFLQHRLPGFLDGTYELTVSQQVLDNDAAPISGDPVAASYAFAVAGDRFRLSNPAESLYAVYPEDNASGEFSTVLPHAVFSLATLPWARTPRATAAPPPAPGADTDANVPAWLAILVLDEGDVASFPGYSTAARDATIGDLLPPSVYPSSTLGSGNSYFDGATKLADALEVGDDPGTPIRVLDLPLAAFQLIAPTITDLALLAHVRSVTLINKPTIPHVSDRGEPTGEFAVVVGNRLPRAGVTSTAHLVSLEGLEALLPPDTGTAIPAPGGSSVRLAVLKSWKFTTTGETSAFVDGLLALNAGRHDAASTTLTYPAAAMTGVIGQAIADGYVAFDQDMRDGGRSVAWYRGPLTPTRPDATRVRLPISSPDQALLLDPTLGMFDVSYAAAWALGRQLALQDLAFATGLYRWKTGLSRRLVDAVEAEIIATGLTAAVAQPQTLALGRIVPAVLHAGPHGGRS